MKVNTKLVIWRMQTTEKSRQVDTGDFLPRYREACQLPPTPRCVDQHLGWFLRSFHLGGSSVWPSSHLSRKTRPARHRKTPRSSEPLKAPLNHTHKGGTHRHALVVLLFAIPARWARTSHKSSSGAPHNLPCVLRRSLLPPSRLGGGNLQE